MSIGGAIGLISGGLLHHLRVLTVGAVRQRADRRRGRAGRTAGAGRGPAPPRRFDLPGAITGTAGVTALVYGLISAATSPDGVSRWGDAKVIASLAAAAVLLAAFAVIETRAATPCCQCGCCATATAPAPT